MCEHPMGHRALWRDRVWPPRHPSQAFWRQASPPRRSKTAVPGTRSPPPVAPAILQCPRPRRASNFQGQSFLLFPITVLPARCQGHWEDSLGENGPNAHSQNCICDEQIIPRTWQQKTSFCFSLEEPPNPKMFARSRNLNPWINNSTYLLLRVHRS